MMHDTDKNSVLIVDDEAANITALTNILSQEYNVYAAKNGPSAIKVAREILPDVILLDILMPEMDGYEVISVLKGLEETRSIPVIFITGLGGDTAEEKGLLSGASDYITKPFHPSIVKLRLQNQIQFSSQFNIVRALSLSDEVTGLFNRRGFDSRLRLELNRANREQTSLCMVLIDIDEFKTYSNEYGHFQCDMLLQTVAKVIKQALKRPLDFVARWGNDEFIALLPDTDLPGALGVAERIRKNIADAQIFCNGGNVTSVTVSIGVNIFSPKQGISVQDFVAGTDEALHAAKKFGRNRVCQYDN